MSENNFEILCRVAGFKKPWPKLEYALPEETKEAGRKMMDELIAEREQRDQTLKADKGKLRMSLTPTSTMISLAKVLTFGAEKYSPNSWQKVAKERYQDALLRHFTSYLEDPQSVDEESGLLHIEHVLCNASFLNHFEVTKKEGKNFTSVVSPSKKKTDVLYLVWALEDKPGWCIYGIQTQCSAHEAYLRVFYKDYVRDSEKEAKELLARLREGPSRQACWQRDSKVRVIYLRCLGGNLRWKATPTDCLETVDSIEELDRIFGYFRVLTGSDAGEESHRLVEKLDTESISNVPDVPYIPDIWTEYLQAATKKGD